MTASNGDNRKRVLLPIADLRLTAGTETVGSAARVRQPAPDSERN